MRICIFCLLCLDWSAVGKDTGWFTAAFLCLEQCLIVNRYLLN